MDNQLNSYLEKIEKNLKPLPVVERLDIVREIQSEMLELQQAGQSAEEICRRLGSPKELARAYLGDRIAKNPTFSMGRLLAVWAYYSLAGLSGMVVLPTLGICAPAFLLCGLITPLLGMVKMVNDLLRLDLPYVNYIGIMGVENPILVFLLCLVMGSVLCVLGYGCWKLLLFYIHSVNRGHKFLAR